MKLKALFTAILIMAWLCSCKRAEPASTPSSASRGEAAELDTSGDSLSSSYNNIFYDEELFQNSVPSDISENNEVSDTQNNKPSQPESRMTDESENNSIMTNSLKEDSGQTESENYVDICGYGSIIP